MLIHIFYIHVHEQNKTLYIKFFLLYAGLFYCFFTRVILIYNLETFTFLPTARLHAKKRQELYTKCLADDADIYTYM